MPRDQAAASQPAPVVNLPGGRTARVRETIVAGRYRLEVLPDDWLSRLHSAGLLDQAQIEAAERLAMLFEASALRDRVAASYDGISVDTFDAEFLLERLNPDEYRCWRRLSRLLNRLPPRCRQPVASVVFWGERPTDVAHLRLGLREIARVLGLNRR